MFGNNFEINHKYGDRFFNVGHIIRFSQEKKHNKNYKIILEKGKEFLGDYLRIHLFYKLMMLEEGSSLDYLSLPETHDEILLYIKKQ